MDDNDLSTETEKNGMHVIIVLFYTLLVLFYILLENPAYNTT